MYPYVLYVHRAYIYLCKYVRKHFNMSMYIHIV
jgi:hypothetical protein